MANDISYIVQNKRNASSIILLNYEESENNNTDTNQNYSVYDITTYIKDQDKIKLRLIKKKKKKKIIKVKEILLNMKLISWSETLIR